MEGFSVKYFPNSVDPNINERRSEVSSYERNNNEQYACDSYAHMFNLYKNILISNISV